MDDKDILLYKYYLETKEPEVSMWNLSPTNLFVEYISRKYFIDNFDLFDGIKVCNVGIGAGEWDVFLSYELHNKGTLTSIDINREICEIYKIREEKENHLNPSIVWCKSILDDDYEENQFDIVTMIGSTAYETKNPLKAFDQCMKLLKPNGFLMYLGFQNQISYELFDEYLNSRGLTTTRFDAFLNGNLPFYIYKIKKT